MPARSFSIAALSPKPLMVTLAPCAARARAMARLMPEVEPVTSADFPFSMTISNAPQFVTTAKENDAKTVPDVLRFAGNVGWFLLQRNIKIGGRVTFSRSPAIRYSAG